MFIAMENRRTYADVCRLPIKEFIPQKIDRIDKLVLLWKKRELASTQEKDIDSATNLHLEVKWAQRVDKVYVTVVLPPDAQDAKVDLTPEGLFSFSATGKNRAGNSCFQLKFLKLGLFDKVNVEESKSCKINTGVRRSIFCVIEKAEKEWWKSLLRANNKPPHFLKVDSDKWVDEDTGAPDLDTGGMDFSQFGGMGGMPGMVVMPGIAAGHEGEKTEAAAAAAAERRVEAHEEWKRVKSGSCSKHY